MLILTRRIHERLIINGDVTVEVLGVKGNQIRLGITAPKNISVHREEIAQRIESGIPMLPRKPSRFLSDPVPQSGLSAGFAT